MRFFYIAAASRDFGLTQGGRDSAQISLTEFGKELVYAGDKEAEHRLKLEAFRRVSIFNKVLEYYQGSSLPEMK